MSLQRTTNEQETSPPQEPRKKRPYHRNLKGTNKLSRVYKGRKPPNPKGNPASVRDASAASLVSENRVRPGTPRGMTNAKWGGVWAASLEKTTRILEEMEKRGMIDNTAPIDTDEGCANAALGFAVSVVITDGVPLKDRLAAAKTVLDFTKAKPATKSEVTVNAAEAFLAGILKDTAE